MGWDPCVVMHVFGYVLGYVQVQWPVEAADQAGGPGESPEGGADEDGSGERAAQDNCC